MTNLLKVFENLVLGNKIIITTDFNKITLFYDFDENCFVYCDTFNKHKELSNTNLLNLLNATVDSAKYDLEK